MGEIVQFPLDELKFRRSVREVEKFLLAFLADGPQIAQRVRRQGEHISRDTVLFDEARINLGILCVQEGGTRRFYWCLPGHGHKVPNGGRATVLYRPIKPWRPTWKNLA